MKELLDENGEYFPKIGAWMSAAMSCPGTCEEMKKDIDVWFHTWNKIERAIKLYIVMENIIKTSEAGMDNEGYLEAESEKADLELFLSVIEKEIIIKMNKYIEFSKKIGISNDDCKTRIVDLLSKECSLDFSR